MSKGNFSKSPEDVLADALAKGYAGVHFEQGVPLLDRDLNLMGDLIATRVRQVFELFLGNGVIGDAFRIDADPSAAFPWGTPPPSGVTPLENDFWINGPGKCLFGGVLLEIPKRMRYSEQRSGAPALTTPKTNRLDLVYLQLSFAEEGGANDSALLNESDVGLRTSVRRTATWTVRVAELDLQNVSKLLGPIAQLDPVVIVNALGTLNVLPQPSFPLGVFIRRADDPLLRQATDIRIKADTLMNMVNRVNFLESALRPLPQDFSPESAPAGAKLTLKGTNLTLGNTIVSIGELNAPITSIGSNELTIEVPYGLPTTGPLDVAVTTSIGRAVCWKKFNALPTPIFAADPFQPTACRAGETLVLNGSGFNGPNLKVHFNDTPATVVTLDSDAKISVQVPALGAGTYSIKVSHDGGSAVTSQSFTVYPTPVINSIGGVNPQSVVYFPNYTKTTITVTGSGLNGPNLHVYFKNDKESYHVDSLVVATEDGTQITFENPEVYNAGTFQVLVSHQGGMTTSVESIAVH